MASAFVIPTLLILASLGFLGWGFWQARKAGRVGILAWLQGAILFLPWLGFFVLFWTGVRLNFVIIIGILIATTGGYLWVGRQLRSAAEEQQKLERERYLARLAAQTGDTPPSAEPTPPLPDLASLEVSSVPAEDRQQLQGLFSIDTFFATESVPFRQGVLYRGNLRADPEIAYRTMSERLQSRFGERYQLFLLSDEEGKPTVLVLPADSDPFAPRKLPVLFSVALLLLSLLAIYLVVSPNGIAPFSQAGLYGALPIAFGVLLTLLAHEAGHRWQAKRYGVRLSGIFLLPLLTPIPVPPAGFAIFPGTFGSITRIDSPPPDRKALFDIAFAGPAAGGLASLAFLVTGLSLSHIVTQLTPTAVPPEGLNVLTGVFVRLLVGPVGAKEFIDLHPFAVIGLVGLQIVALTLLPAGQLDGGRIVQAVYGRRTARIAGIVTLIILALIGLFVPQYLYWAAIVFLFARNPERPALNELAETDSRRDGLAILALFIMAAILLPLTPPLALRIGLGG